MGKDCAGSSSSGWWMTWLNWMNGPALYSRGKQLLLARQVEPELRLVEPGDRGEGLPLLGFAELDVDASPVRQPAGHCGFTAEPGVRVLDAPVVLRPELVLRSERLGVAAGPEGRDEGLAFGFGLEALEGVLLAVAEDVGGVVFQPPLVLVRERKEVLRAGEAGNGEDERCQQSGKRIGPDGGDGAHWSRSF